MRAWVTGSRRFEGNREYVTMVANAGRLIIWQAIKYAKEKGIKEFDMGGYYTGKAKDEQKEKIGIFKRSFGGELTTNYIYRKDYSRIYQVSRRIYRIWLVSLYRLIAVRKLLSRTKASRRSTTLPSG